MYSVALTLTGLAWVLPHALQTVIFPRAASLDAAAQAGEVTAEESDAAVTRATRHSVLLLLPSGLIVLVLLALVPLVYGREFDQTVMLGLVLLPGVLALGTGKVLAQRRRRAGLAALQPLHERDDAAITLALYFTMIPAFGEWGAAVASSASYLASALISAAFFRTVLGISLSTALIPTARGPPQLPGGTRRPPYPSPRPPSGGLIRDELRPKAYWSDRLDRTYTLGGVGWLGLGEVFKRERELLVEALDVGAAGGRAHTAYSPTR